jgi:tetratricopeptide (TPR) repeat protein
MPKFNWNRVIRHELVHVFNLQQTGARVPHWFTEGLAVRYEGKDIPPSWHALLAEKYQNKDLLNLDNILLGFVRPRSQDQWQQAYLQSLLYVEYLTKTHGEPTIGKMLAAFAEGLDTGLALEKACGVKKDAFELGYREFLGERVKNIATRPIPKQMTLKELRAAHAKTPDDLDIAARLADANYKFGKRKDAKDLADLVLSKDPKNTTAVCVKAQVLRDEKQPDSAYALLDSVVTDDLKDVAPLKVLADIQIATKKYSQAARTCERARKLDPHNVEWLKALTVLYVTHLKGTEPNKLKEVLEELANLDVDFLLPRESLAGIFHDAGNQAKAEQYARMALEIDVTNRNCQRILVDALMQQNKQDEANRLKTMFGL